MGGSQKYDGCTETQCTVFHFVLLLLGGISKFSLKVCESGFRFAVHPEGQDFVVVVVVVIIVVRVSYPFVFF